MDNPLNSDKLIQEKMLDFKASFEEQDWLAMEKMLEEKPKRRAIIWWWNYGLAAALIGATVGLGIWSQVSKEDKYVSMAARQNPTNYVLSARPIHAIETLSALQTLANEKGKQSKTQTGISMLAAKENQKGKANSKESKVNTGITAIASMHLTIEDFINSSYLNINFLSMATIDEPIFNANKLADIPLQKKPTILKFMLGADLAALTSMKLENSASTKSISLYNDGLSDVGLNFQVTILDKWGIYTGLKYADRQSFMRIDSNLLNANVVLLSGTSKIEGLSIPIGLSYNFYNQRYCTLYGKLGMNNIIPLREVIKLETVDVNTPIPTANTVSIGNAFFSSVTDNGSGATVQNETKSSSNMTADNSPAKYVIKQKSREKILAELQVAFGVHIKATPKLAFSLESMYEHDFKNKYRAESANNFALSTGLVYSF